MDNKKSLLTCLHQWIIGLGPTQWLKWLAQAEGALFYPVRGQSVVRRKTLKDRNLVFESGGLRCPCTSHNVEGALYQYSLL